MFEAAGHARHVTASFTHFSGALTTLMNSAVIATLPSFAARSYAAMTDLSISPVPFPVPSFGCFRVRNIARHNKPHHQWLRQFIGELAQSPR